MAVLPSGTVTFLFTDLEGSTRLWEEYPEAMVDALARHDEIVRSAIASHDGQIVKGTGDGFHSVFVDATRAVEAAVDAQRRLRREVWGAAGELRVRMGLHSGAAQWRGGDYPGPTVNRAARVMGIAYGGQVLVSEATGELVRDRLGDVQLLALGEHRLRDLSRPEQLFQVRASGLQEAFPPLRSLEVRPGNVPANVDSFVGRRGDMDAVRALLRQRRFVTLTGPGGSGKTRLALEVARSLGAEYPDGVWLVDLAPIDDETLIAEATMAALGLPSSDAAPKEVLRSHLADRGTLLIFDNCEHLIAGASAFLAELAQACPRVCILATSREPLRVPGEAEYAVQGLRREEAIELFAERVPGQRSIDDRDAIERICATLEGIPLAIELAAAKLRVLSPAQLADRLNDQLGVLVRGKRTAPPRQRTLRATLDWSYNLLDDDERVVFRRVAIFAGGFTADAAEQVVADDHVTRRSIDDLLERLVERSLLMIVPQDSGVRFRLLEPVRQYAAERLSDAAERDTLAGRHLDWVRHFTRKAFLEFFVSQREASSRVSEEHPNICQALELSITQRDGYAAARIIDAVAYIWFTTGQPDARVWCERALAVSTDAPTVARAGALVATAMMLQDALQYDAAMNLLVEALELYRSARNVLGEAWALTWLGRNVYFGAPTSAEAEALFEEALVRYREADVAAGIGWCLVFLAQVAMHREDVEIARRRAEEALQFGMSAHVGQVVADALRVLAVMESWAGDFDSADRRIAEVIAIHEASGDHFQLVTAHDCAAEMAASRGDIARAASHLTVCAQRLGAKHTTDRALEFVQTVAYMAYADGRTTEAAALFGARLGLGSSTFPHRFRPIMEALDQRGLQDEIAAGANLSLDDALENAVEVVSRVSSSA
jgi:predicted ATPase/class 3 adenylate cyclase